jgi:hypothetical protein
MFRREQLFKEKESPEASGDYFTAKGRTHVFQTVLRYAGESIKDNRDRLRDVLFERARTCPACSALRRKYRSDIRCILHRVRIRR